ncbi:putative homoserine kinase [Helianthus debilis subsp. tardiflorus]
MLGQKLPKSESVLDVEAKLSGYHADNVAPSPLEKDLWFVLVNLKFEAQTKKMRAVLPKDITIVDSVWNCSQAGALVAGVLQGDLVGFGSSDRIVEEWRGALNRGWKGLRRRGHMGV